MLSALSFECSYCDQVKTAILLDKSFFFKSPNSGMRLCLPLLASAAAQQLQAGQQVAQQISQQEVLQQQQLAQQEVLQQQQQQYQQQQYLQQPHPVYPLQQPIAQTSFQPQKRIMRSEERPAVEVTPDAQALAQMKPALTENPVAVQIKPATQQQYTLAPSTQGLQAEQAALQQGLQQVQMQRAMLQQGLQQIQQMPSFSEFTNQKLALENAALQQQLLAQQQRAGREEDEVDDRQTFRDTCTFNDLKSAWTACGVQYDQEKDVAHHLSLMADDNECHVPCQLSAE